MFMPPVFPAHWHVSQPVLIADTFSSLVWKVSLPDGTPAIVKGLKPIEDIADELRGADYLVWRNGRGAVRLLGRENNLMLLEYAGERMLSHIVAEHGDYQATEIAAELMAKLYAASEEPLPSALLPIRDRFAALFQRARDDQNAGCQTDYVHAAIIADQMMSNASELRGLHGDLHHENIMFSSRGWLVIDPVGLVGEVGFGAANMFYDPADRDDLCLDPRRIAQMADAFSRALDVDPRRLLEMGHDANYGVLNDIARGQSDPRKIVLQWDEMIRTAGSLKLGKVQASVLVRSLLKSERPSGLTQAIIEVGRINKTLYLLNYIDDEDYRRRILTQLNRGESRHAVARAICHGQKGEIRKRYTDGQEDQLGALGLVTNAVVLWNTMYMQAALDHLRAQGETLNDEDIARLSPLCHGHINMLGHYSFTLAELVTKGHLRPLKEASEVENVA